MNFDRARQTVTVVDLPGLGVGKLIWRNGPACFVADSDGSRSFIDAADFGGANAKGSWLRVRMGQRSYEARVIKHGDNHNRYYSPTFGDGWLVQEAKREDSPGYWYRFEALDGTVRVRFDMAELGVGRPEYFRKAARARSRMPKMGPDEENWMTSVTVAGETYAFRRGGPPPEQNAPTVDSGRQLSLGGER